MNLRKLIAVATVTILIFASAAIGGQLEKRHQLGLRLGMWNQTTDARTAVGPGEVATSVKGHGLLGGLSYGHWLSEGLELCIGVDLMAADVETEVASATVTTETGCVASVLMSVKQYFPKSTYTSSVRPYVEVGVGLFTGGQERTETGQEVVVESRSETVLGGRIGAGSDFILGRRFLTGVSLGYNLMADFDEPIGGSRNYSGPQFAFGLSYLFGAGVR